MKTLDIALKDFVRSFRNAFFLGFGIGVPVLMGVIFYFAFGGLASEDGFSIPQVDVLVVNLDEPVAAYGDFSVGQTVIEVFQENELLFEVTNAENAASGRDAVDNQEADVAVIIPAGFTAAAFEPGAQAEIEVYQDPTLTLGPSIVRSVVSSIVDGFAGAGIAVRVADSQLSERGITLDENGRWEIYGNYGNWARALGESGGLDALLAVQSPISGEEEEDNGALAMVGGIMTGMMIFYAFYTGAASAMSILQENEEGTLPRLFTTPTPMSAILGGKLVAVFALVVVQVLILMAFSSLIFKTSWGAPGPLSLALVGLVVLASSFGIFAMSLLKDTRQAGVVIGGAMTVLGMVGISSVFTANVPGTGGGLAEILPLFVPQGWAMRAWQLAMDGGSTGDVLLPFAVMIVLTVGFFTIGVLRFRKRFA
jgi:ABC-2 type transport system permease protein